MIRPAQTEDLSALLAMGRAFNEEAGYAESVPFCEASFQLSLAIFATANLLLAVEEGGEVVGMAAADVAPTLSNRAVVIGQEAFWYLKPNHRKGHGKKLLAALECAAREQGAAFFDAVAEEGKRSEPLARVYRAGSYNPISRTFRKGL